MLEQGRKVTQAPAQAAGQGAPAGGAPRGAAAGMQAPDAMQFLTERLQGTLGSRALRQPGERRRSADVRPWLPLIKRLAGAPGASGVLAQAFITQFGNLSRGGLTYEVPTVDMQAAEDGLQAYLDTQGV